MYIISFDVGLRNLAYIVIEWNETLGTHHIVKWEKVDLGFSKYDIQKVLDSLLDVLDQLYYHQSFGASEKIVVLIEHQMTAVMKQLQTAINMYFKVVAKYSCTTITTHYISPKLKLKIANEFPDYSNVDTRSSSKYKQNKLDSVNLCKWLLENKYTDKEQLENLNRYKKKDDLSDVYLQALGWMSAYKSI